MSVGEKEPTLFRCHPFANGFAAHVTDSQLSGEIKAEILRIELGQLIERNQPTIVVLDMSEVKMISSVVIGALVQIQKKMVSIQGELRQCCLPPLVQTIYKTSALTGSVFSIFATRDEAIAAPFRADSHQ